MLRTYQSGKQYAANKLVLYNGAPAYTNATDGGGATFTFINDAATLNLQAKFNNEAGDQHSSVWEFFVDSFYIC